MYAPNLFSHDLFALWSQTEKNDQQQQAKPAIPGVLGSANSGDVESLGKQLRLLFAPPLLAYSADYPGASLAQLEYTIQSTAANASHKYTTSPLIQLKIDQLEQIRNTGYTSIRPIGIEKTLQEVDYEESRQNNASYHQFEDHSYLDTAENTNTEDQSAIAEGPEIDLDAQVVNADESQQLDDFEEDDAGEGEVLFEEEDSEMLESVEHDVNDLLHRRPLLLTLRLPPQQPEDVFRDSMDDEGFMADEVEYQNDHSLNADSNATQHMLINSASTTSATNLNSGVSVATTNVTTLPSLLDGLPTYSRPEQNDENDENNENNENDENNDHEEVDHSEMDMMIEDN